MTDYIYGYRLPEGTVYFHTRFNEDQTRAEANPLRIPVSAIEDLPAPKPALPTTPGSVVLHPRWGHLVLAHGYDEMVMWGNARTQAYPDEIHDYEVVFDAGASA